MDRESILAMQPGRELDALVAEKVMGFTGIRFGRNDPNAVWVEMGSRRKFQPSTDIAAAWEVLEKHSEIYLKKYKVMSNGHRYACRVDEDTIVSSLTAPEAICKAALIAVLDKE